MSFNDRIPNRVAQRTRACAAGFGALLTAGFISPQPSSAASNVDPGQAHVWSANAGWLNWRPDQTNGVEVTQFICAGFIYSGNLGWIHVGDGTPANGIQYQNNSASDFGVNLDAAGNLRGLAYGANIGWISFSSIGAPHLDLHSGTFGGFAYGANIGWISLDDAAFSLAVNSIAAGPDTDADGLPDAWELTWAGDLSMLSQRNDSDQDGQSDLQEYLADTDPLDSNDQLRVLSFLLSPDKSTSSIAWTSKTTRQYVIETRADFASSTDWRETASGLQLADGAVTTRNLPALPGHGFLRVRAVRPLSQ